MKNYEKVAVVTGASSGIGLETAKKLAELGFKVYGIARNEFESEHFKFFSCDVTDENAVKEVVSKIYNLEHRIDCLINCAGIGISGSVENTERVSVNKILDVNLTGTFLFCKEVLPIMREIGGGRIINIGSVAGTLPIPFQTFYSATKSAVESFSRALSMEVRPFNIKVVCVMPGDAKTGFTTAREKNVVDSLEYGNRIKKSVEQMEKDEQGGMSAESVAKVIVKQVIRHSPPPTVTAGFKYKLFIFLNRFLPKRVIDYILYLMYAK